MATYRNDPRVITLRHAAICHETGERLARGTEALWYPRGGRLYGLETEAYRQYLSDRHDMDMEDYMARSESARWS